MNHLNFHIDESLLKNVFPIDESNQAILRILAKAGAPVYGAFLLEVIPKFKLIHEFDTIKKQHLFRFVEGS